jgi:hypothetical protein
VGEALQMRTRRARGLPVDRRLPDEGHGAQRENRVQMIGRALLFLRQHLVGKPSDAAAR